MSWPLPCAAKMIGLLLGYDDDLWPKLKHWSEASIATGGGPRYRSTEGVEAVLEFAVACTELYTTKQGCPAGDLMSRWIEVESDTGMGWWADRRSGWTRSSPTRCCCSTAGPRPPAP